MNKIQQITTEQALDGNKTFYAKVWQTSGYYPIYRYDYKKSEDAFEWFVKLESEYKSLGIIQPIGYTNKDWLDTRFSLMRPILSFEEPHNQSDFAGEYELTELEKKCQAERKVIMHQNLDRYSKQYYGGSITNERYEELKRYEEKNVESYGRLQAIRLAATFITRELLEK
jgi:hypothetical protein